MIFRNGAELHEHGKFVACPVYSLLHIDLILDFMTLISLFIFREILTDNLDLGNMEGSIIFPIQFRILLCPGGNWIAYISYTISDFPSFIYKADTDALIRSFLVSALCK